MNDIPLPFHCHPILNQCTGTLWKLFWITDAYDKEQHGVDNETPADENTDIPYMPSSLLKTPLLKKECWRGTDFEEKNDQLPAAHDLTYLNYCSLSENKWHMTRSIVAYIWLLKRGELKCKRKNLQLKWRNLKEKECLNVKGSYQV